MEIARLLKLKEVSEPFSALGLDLETCVFEDIRQAYRRIAKLIHPDKCKLPNTSDAFHIVEKAYSKIPSEDVFKRFKTAHERKKQRAKDNEELRAKGGVGSGGGGGSAGAPGTSTTYVSPEDAKEALLQRLQEERILRAERTEEERLSRKRKRDEQLKQDEELNEKLQQQRRDWEEMF